MGHESREAEVGDRLHHEPVVQLLRVVDFVAAWIAAGVEVADPLEVVADVPDDVAVHDLGVVDVEQDLHPGRIHALHHVDSPREVVEHVVLVIHLAVQILHADRDALVLGLGLHAIEERHAVVGTFRVGHASPVPRERDEVRHTGRGGLIDHLAHRRFDLGVVLGPVQRAGDRAAASARHRRYESVLLHDGPVRRRDQIESLDADARRLPAAVVESNAASKDAARNALLQAAFGCGRLWGLFLTRGSGSSERQRRRNGSEKCSSIHCNRLPITLGASRLPLRPTTHWGSDPACRRRLQARTSDGKAIAAQSNTASGCRNQVRPVPV